MGVTLLLGGARSGKSGLAVRIAEAWRGPVAMIATATAGDGEMAARIAAHRAERPAAWATVEEPLRLADAVAGCDPAACVIVDCLGLWVSNAMGEGWGDADVEAHAARAAAAAAARTAPTVVVTNDVGSGLVPATPLGRRYRDVLGRVNQTWARHARRAYLVAAGRVLALAPPDDVIHEITDHGRHT
ncbi:MAG: bifunctional adenosylcobinamide kinase/adenosylcobinamide-phosphate guanylyltransferase [Actinomycetota bacterium]